jgi:peptide/nickel transport system permease protein
MSDSKSLNQKAWMRFKRNKAAMFGLFVIIGALFVSVFAYRMAPDHTVDANEQTLQLEMMPPGFKIRMLYVSKPPIQETVSDHFRNFFLGSPSRYSMIPILEDYRLKKDFVYVSVYKGKKTKSEERKYYYTEILGIDSIHQTQMIEKSRGHVRGRDVSTDLTTPAKRMSIISDTFAYDNFCMVIRDEVHRVNMAQRTYWLGTDRFGRDILSRLLVGSRISLFVGLISVIISLIIGIVAGALAGYFRGWVDAVILWIINVFWSIPTVLLAMGLYVSAGALIPSKLLLIFIAVGLTMWVEVARIVRGQFILVREFEYVTAAQSLGFNSVRTIFRHILPNITGPVIVVACANFANAILIESGLSYIGLGVQPPTPSWGGMLSEYKNFIDSDKAYLALAPGIAIMLLVLAFNLVGNGLRDALDVKGKAE